ncbi:CORO7 (predicted) [Pycnogonum litorale]
MFRFKASKYKNTAPKVPKKSEGWILDISSGSPQSCGQHIKASASFMVFNTDHRGGGSLGILPLNDHGRKHKGTLPLIHAHSDTITDFEFSPFDDGLLATGSSDTTIKLWQIPESGVAEGDSISSPIYTLTEENRRVENVVFNPAAEFILASSSFTTVKVWDLTKQQEIYVSDDLEDQCYGIDWKDDGSLIVSVCKDQQMRILDPRADKIVQQCQSHASPKDSRVVWIGDTEKILTTGCNTMRQREVTVRDIRNLNSPLTEISLDLASGALMPLFDADTNMLFLAAKGENTILFWELSNEDPYLTEASRFVSDVQSNGACLVPKRVMDVMQGEVDRILQLSSKCIVPITYQVPRRSYREYHSELFPDTKGVVPGMTCQDWLSGKNFVPQSISLDPSKRPAEGYARFSVNPKEKEASIPHRQGKATTAESKSLHNGGNKTNSDKTAKDTQNLHTQTQTDVSKPKPTVSNKPASVQGDSSGETESTPLKHSTKHDDTVSTPPNITIIPDQSSNDSNEDIIVTNVKSKQKKFQEKIDVVTEESPVLRRKDIISNKDVQRVSSFKTPTRPTSKVFQMRVSKFRHLKGVPMHQKHHIEGIRNISRSVPSESNGFDANRTRAAVPLAGPGGQIAILELSKTGKLSDAVLNRVICSAKVMDFEWDPFNDNRLFAVCDDGRMLIWNIPEGGLTESTNQPSECIMAHNDKIYIIKSHPFADNIVATASYDMSIKIWDLSDTDEPKFILDGHTDQIFGIAWSNDGQYIATVCKDKKLRVYQPLKSTLPIKETAGPPGVRGARVVWVLNGEALLVSGFDR